MARSPVWTQPPVDGTFKEVLALLGRHDKTDWDKLVKQLNPSRVGRDFAEETATRIHHNLGSLPARLPAQLWYHTCLLTHNALPTRGRIRSFSRGGLTEWRSSRLACHAAATASRIWPTCTHSAQSPVRQSP